ncbi:MAG: O-antigen ligase family protein [Deltaproteobacteria bacterium]|nr:O-antigen ligase family protein [Deltaproteobacteria bacterium]
MPAQVKSDHIYYGITFLVALSPLAFFPSLISLYRLPKITFISLCVTALIWLWLFLLIQEKGEKPLFPLAAPLILYLSISVLSLTQAINLFEGIFALSQKFTYILLFWLVVNHVKTKERFEIVLLWAMGSAFVVSLIGIYQKFGGDIPGLVKLASPGSTFGNTSMAAQYILLISPFPYMFFLSSKERWKELLFAICAATMTTYLLYAGRRAAWAGLIVAFLSIVIFSRLKRSSLGPQIANLKSQIWHRKIAFGCIVLSVVAMNVIPPYVVPDWNIAGFPSPVARFATVLELDQDRSFLDRFAMWVNTLEMIKDHPLLGVGKGNFKIVYPLYAEKKVKDTAFGSEVQPREAHNDYVELLGETGILGFLSFFWILVLIGLRVWNSIPTKESVLILTLSFSLMALLVEAFFDFPFELPVSEAFFWLFVGLLWVSFKDESLAIDSGLRSEEEHHLHKSRPAVRPALVLVGLVAALSILISGVNLTFLRAEFHFSRGSRLANEDRPDLAVLEIERAEFLNPTNHRYPFLRGLLLLRTEKYQEAIQANLRTLSLHPNYINAYTNLGVAYASAGKTKAAEWAWKKALEIWPDHNDARNNLATTYGLQGKKKEAIALFRESLQRNPKDVKAKQKLDTLLTESNQTQP